MVFIQRIDDRAGYHRNSLSCEWHYTDLALILSERLYEESLGIDREYLEREVRKFELALNSQDKRIIEKERNKLKEFLDGWESE